jgi:exopolysaccharide biosynthesis polyprenyl glycosylphosphotransferase
MLNLTASADLGLLEGAAEPLAAPATENGADGQVRAGLVDGSRDHRRQQRRWRRTVLLVDAVALSAAWATSGYPAASPAPAVVFIAIALVFTQVHLHKFSLRISIVDEIGPLASATLVAGGLLIAIEKTMRPWVHAHAASEVAPVCLLATVYLIGGRCGHRLTTRILGKGRRPRCPTLIIGTAPFARVLARRLRERPEFGLNPVGFLEDQPSRTPFENTSIDGEIPLLGGIATLEEHVRVHGVNHVVITFSEASHEVLRDTIWRCRQQGLQVLLLPRLYEAMPGDVEVEHIGGIPLLRIRPIPRRDSQLLVVKHAGDRLVAACLLVVLSPLMLAISLAVLVSSSGPILFRERRMGLRGHEFEILKFRTMILPSEDDTIARARVLLGDPVSTLRERRTAVGRMLRKASLDELPQLINVFRGEMSIVGPRPENPTLVRILQDKIYRYDDRHRVRAGITGWAQVQGLRGATSLQERIEWDNFYIEHWSLWFDLKIFFLTLPAVFSGQNAG